MGRPAGGSSSLAATLESSDGRLAAALLQLLGVPSAVTHRQVAREYRRLRVLDKAHEHFSSAVRLDPTDAESFEALARIWRDWGTPHLGLGDAYRAVYHAPRSASAANTLGTLLHAMKRIEDAKAWYARAILLEPDAPYALNNLCYAEVMSGGQLAIETCQRAVAAAPGTTAAQNNLALAYTAAGERDIAKKWFRRANEQPSIAAYNYGIAMMAARSYKEASSAFHEALQADPHFTLAAHRANQARNAMAKDQNRVDD
jgi:Tfp pilus assembly protein PilF